MRIEGILEKLGLFAWTVIAVLAAAWVAIGFGRYVISFADGRGGKPEVIQVIIDGKEVKPAPDGGQAIRVIGESAGSAAE